jgi:hypothetical protein
LDQYRLINRTQPYPFESLLGFLMRCACANHYRGHQEILQYALDASSTNPQVEQTEIPRLAIYTRNSVNELSQLSGISRQVPKKGREWRILGEWLSKSIFLKLRHAPICPRCLQEQPFLQGVWHLAFNTACWRHNSQLIERCPQCKRQLALSRRHPEYCECGFDLRKSDTTLAEAEQLLIARIIANRSDGPLNLDSVCIPANQVENLARLSLDGLCHSLWFLGHHLRGNFSFSQGSGPPKLDDREIRKMIAAVCWLLSDWPSRLNQVLSRQIALNSKWSGDKASMRLLVPIQRYYESNIGSNDFRFISGPYETFVRQLVKQAGIKSRPSSFDSPQLELDLS